MQTTSACTSSQDSSMSNVALDLAEMEETTNNVPACRVCWDAAGCDPPSQLVAPCSCKGTQEFVHVKCLRRWQENVQKRDAMDERAYRCGVCRTRYTLVPPDPKWLTRLWQVLRGLGGIICVSLLAFGLSGPPWPHLALLVLVLLGSRSHGLVAAALLVATTTLAVLHVGGMRVVMQLDPGGRLGLAVVRHGAPVAGLGPGTLLVASEELRHSLIFRRSVVLLYRHSPGGGARGVILTQPMHTPPPYASEDALDVESGEAAPGAAEVEPRGAKANKTAAPRGGKAAVRHFLGGPVGLPGEGMHQELVVLHSVGGVEGAQEVLPQVYEGGALAEVIERSARGGGAGPTPVLLFHGLSTWAQGQLEGEIRAGSWAFGPATAGDVTGAHPEGLWAALAGSDRLATYLDRGADVACAAVADAAC